MYAEMGATWVEVKAGVEARAEVWMKAWEEARM